MSKILCSYSGILFQCEYMPLSLSSREYHHPLFTVPKKRLLALAADWALGKLPKTESYLLYLSLLHSTGLIMWRVPAQFTDKSSAIVASNMEALLHIIGKIDVITHPSFTLPKFVIAHDTRDLTNSYHWIQSWISNYQDWYDGHKFSALIASAERREAALEKLIKSGHATEITASGNIILRPKNDKLGIQISDWASEAGNFPESMTPHPLVPELEISISDYWKQIIRASIDMNQIWRYPKADILELISHCEDNIPHGSIYAHTLMSRIKGGLQKYEDFESFGDVDIDSDNTPFTLLDNPRTDAMTINTIAIIQSAPKDEPRPENYPTKFAYIKASMNYRLAQRKIGK